jgi:hypothetical protein
MKSLSVAHPFNWKRKRKESGVRHWYTLLSRVNLRLFSIDLHVLESR